MGDSFSRTQRGAWARIEPLMPQAEGGLVRGVILASQEVIRCGRTINGREITHSLPLSQYRAPGACGKAWVVPHNRRPKRQNLRNGSHEMRVLLSTYGSRGDGVMATGVWR